MNILGFNFQAVGIDGNNKRNGEKFIDAWGVDFPNWFKFPLPRLEWLKHIYICRLNKGPTQHFHNHSSGFWTFILWGGYLEFVLDPDTNCKKLYKRKTFQLRHISKETYHRVAVKNMLDDTF